MRYSNTRSLGWLTKCENGLDDARMMLMTAGFPETSRGVPSSYVLQQRTEQSQQFQEKQRQFNKIYFQRRKQAKAKRDSSVAQSIGALYHTARSF